MSGWNLNKGRNGNKGKKSQISIEYLIIVGFALAMTLPLFIIFHDQSKTINNEITSSQIQKVSDEIITAVDSVYYMGPPSTKTIKVYFPDFVKNVTLNNHSISFWIESSSGDYEVPKWTSATLDGQLRHGGGLHVITIRANENNVTLSE